MPNTIRLLFILCLLSNKLYGMVAGGRPNSISGGNNAFAGVVNPANAVWIPDRFDIGVFLVHQKLTFNNHNNNPFFNPGKINQTFRAEYIWTGDAALHKKAKIKSYECSLSVAAYTTPGYIKIRTKRPIPLIGNTPIFIIDKTQALSTIFSLKLNEKHSIGFSIDYFYLSHLRNGFQNADNALRSATPGNVTNNGVDHSQGFGLTLGWRCNLSRSLTFGLAYIKKSYVGQYRKYRGYEPHHAKNYIPQTIGGGFTYRFSQKIAGRLEVVWTNLGNLPNANNTLLPNGELNRNKRGSSKSPGSGLQDATLVNMGFGYKVNPQLSIGLGLSHRIKLPRKSSYIISHSYRRQVIYNLLTFGVDYTVRQHNVFFTLSHGFTNHQSGKMPVVLGGGQFSSEKKFNSLSIAWGYLY